MTVVLKKNKNTHNTATQAADTPSFLNIITQKTSYPMQNIEGNTVEFKFVS